MSATTPRLRVMTETFALRDDEAGCNDCDWSWKQPSNGPYSLSDGGKAAKQHARESGHTAVVRRVQFVRHWGFK